MGRPPVFIRSPFGRTDFRPVLMCGFIFPIKAIYKCILLGGELHSAHVIMAVMMRFMSTLKFIISILHSANVNTVGMSFNYRLNTLDIHFKFMIFHVFCQQVTKCNCIA